MKAEEIAIPTVSVAYVLLTLEQAAERGLSREQVLKDIDISAAHLADPTARLPFLQYGRIVARVLRLSGDGGLGYDFGLRAGLTSHGFPGLGMMNHETLREAATFGLKYLMRLRTPGFTVQYFVEGRHAVIDVRESVQYGPLRRYAFDMVLVGMTHVARQFLSPSEIELWFDCPEPDYYARYRDRLPAVRFDTGANQIRCPVEALDRSVGTANPVTMQLVLQQCEREMALLGRTEGAGVLSRVRALLVNSSEGYPDLEMVAKHLSMSSRTLKRRLNQHGFTFRKLLDEVRLRDSIRLVQDTTLSVEEVAWRLGYTAHGNFIRAFRSWTGTTPASFRRQWLERKSTGTAVEGAWTKGR